MLEYRNDLLHLDGHSLAELARAVPTPFYAYGLPTLRERARAFQEAFPGALIAFALKANRHPVVLHTLARMGLAADVVSLGEWDAAIAAGFPPERLVVNGNAKEQALLERAVAAGAHSINLDALEEIPRLVAAARSTGRTARVALRINPGLDVRTHPHLRVASAGSQFGLPPEQVLEAARRVQDAPELELVGIHLHPGSQLLEEQDWQAVAGAARSWVLRLREGGFPVHVVNWGGGLGITYTEAPDPTPFDLARVYAAAVADLDVAQVLEPGRWIVARAGVLVTRVVQAKEAWGRRFVAVDAGMNALLRPVLFGPVHRVWPVVRSASEEVPTTVVGPNCNSGDVLSPDALLPRDLKSGDLLAVLDVGAYGAVMANGYNARPLPREVVVG